MSKYPDPPQTLSEAIRLALWDLLQVEARPDLYEVNMGETWHEPRGNRCHVCLAGAVMAGTLREDTDQDVSWSDYPAPWSSVLAALDDVRCSCAGGAVAEFYDREYDDECEAIESAAPSYPHYYRDPDAFKRGLVKLADWLQERGL